MEKFIQKFKRAYLALCMEEHKALQWAHTNGQVEYHKLNSLCSEGLIWHALTHRVKGTRNAILSQVNEEIAAEVVRTEYIHPTLLAKAQERLG